MYHNISIPHMNTLWPDGGEYGKEEEYPYTEDYLEWDEEIGELFENRTTGFSDFSS